MKLTASDIAEAVNGTVIGNPSRQITHVAKIEEANNESLCFVANKKYIHHLKTTAAAVVIVSNELSEFPPHLTVIQAADPYVAFTMSVIQFFNYKNPHQGIHPTAVIEESATIGKDVHIGPHCYIAENVTIGENTKLMANCSVYEGAKIGKNTTMHAGVSVYYNCEIGNNCIIHSNSVIGSDGFGHAPLPDGTYVKIPQIGNVVIEDNVEIGSNCSLDRAAMGSTIIREGCKLDNLVQIAHGVEIGKNSVIAGLCAIAGSTKIGENCVLAGQAGVVGHISIANGVQIGAQSGVTKSIKEEGLKVTDSPHLPLGTALKSRVLYRQLPGIESRIRELENKVKES